MQVTDIIGQAVSKVGLAPSDAVPTKLWSWALGALNRLYEDVWNSYPFRDEKMVSVSLSVAAGTSEVVLDQQVDAVRALRQADGAMFPVNELILSNWGGVDAFSDTGSPLTYFNLNDSPVYVQPTAAEKVKVVSTSTADTGGPKVRILGTTTSGDVFEELTLTGTTPTGASTNTFSAILAVSKPQTSGHVTITGVTSAVSLGTIYSWDTRPSYRRLRVYPIPEAETTLYMEAVRRWRPLVSQYDTIGLRHCQNALFQMLTAELYEYTGEPDKAAMERQKAAESLRVAMVRQEFQDQTDRRFALPAYSLFDDGGGSWDYGSKTAL